jgi:hypothetical protein
MRTPPRQAARTVRLLLAVLASLILARWVVAGGFSKPLIPATPTLPQVAGTAPSGGVPELRGRRLYLGGRRPLVADAGGRAMRTLPIGVDGRTSVLRQGRYLVVRVAEPLQEGPALALATDRPSTTTPLGSALDALPSPQSDRVWLLHRRTLSQQRAFALQEVDLATGRPLASITLPNDAEPVAMVNEGVIVRDLQQGLAVRDLASGRERERFGTDLTFVDATARLLAYLDDRGRLHVRDLTARRDRVVRPTGIPNWFPLGQPVAGAGCCDQFGAFSLDGRRLAVYLQLRRPAQPGLAMVDVARAEARPVPGSDKATPFGCQPCLAWSADDWLFFFSGGPPPDVVAAWRPGRLSASPLNLPLDGTTTSVGGMAA